MSHRDYSERELLRRMEIEMQRIADEAMRGFFAGVPPPDKFWQPHVDVHETPDTVVVKMELAGVKGDELTVSLLGDDRVLVVSGERHELDEERAGRIRCYQLEIYFGPFERQVQLPPDVKVDRDGIQARYRDGLLVVILPKRADRPIEGRSVQVEG